MGFESFVTFFSLIPWYPSLFCQVCVSMCDLFVIMRLTILFVCHIILNQHHDTFNLSCFSPSQNSDLHTSVSKSARKPCISHTMALHQWRWQLLVPLLICGLQISVSISVHVHVWQIGSFRVPVRRRQACRMTSSSEDAFIKTVKVVYGDVWWELLTLWLVNASACV